MGVHTGSPGITGANEATGGSPAYARQPTTWDAEAKNSRIAGSQVSINLPAGTYLYAGLWTERTGGSFIDTVAISSTTLGAQAVLLVVPIFTMV